MTKTNPKQPQYLLQTYSSSRVSQALGLGLDASSSLPSSLSAP